MKTPANIEAIEEQQLKAGQKKCPHCAELVKEEAKVCKHCNRDFD